MGLAEAMVAGAAESTHLQPQARDSEHIGNGKVLVIFFFPKRLAPSDTSPPTMSNFS